MSGDVSATQTRCAKGQAVVYVLGTDGGPCKIGVTSRPKHRAREVLAQWPGAIHGRGSEMVLLSPPMMRDIAIRVEAALHHHFRRSACDQAHAGWYGRQWRTDWFRVTAESASVATIAALEAAGVEFIAENGGGAGVRMRIPGREGRR